MRSMRFFRNDTSSSVEDDDESSRKSFMCKKVFNLIHKEKWDKVPKLLKGKYAAEICSTTDPTGLTILGMAVGSNPPLPAIEQILKINPELSSRPDNYGALPLHLACLNGASAAVIKFLIKHDKGATVRIPDEDKRVPLHHAVEFSARVDIQENASPQEFNSNFSDSRSSLSSYSNFEEDLEIISALCKAAPEFVTFMDKNGDTPIDVSHVIKGIAHTEKQHFRVDKVYSILRSASVSVYKKQKKEWEKQGFQGNHLSSNSIKDSSDSEAEASAWSGGSVSEHSKSVGSKSDYHFACSDQDLDLTKEPTHPKGKGDRRFLDKAKMKYFGFV